jgi:hypothetical protein
MIIKYLDRADCGTMRFFRVFQLPATEAYFRVLNLSLLRKDCFKSIATIDAKLLRYVRVLNFNPAYAGRMSEKAYRCLCLSPEPLYQRYSAYARDFCDFNDHYQFQISSLCPNVEEINLSKWQIPRELRAVMQINEAVIDRWARSTATRVFGYQVLESHVSWKSISSWGLDMRLLAVPNSKHRLEIFGRLDTAACKTGFPFACSCRNFYLALDQDPRPNLTKYG